MNGNRRVISDAVRERVAPYLPGKASDSDVTGRDNRLFVEAVLRWVRIGSPWRVLPAGSGDWSNVFQRFWHWARKGGRSSVGGSVRGTGLRACAHRRHHRQYSPEGERRRRGARDQAIGRSKGGLTTRIVVPVDALGYPVRFELLPGQRHDPVGVRSLIEDIHFDALLGDKAFDADWLRADPNERGARAVIPPKANRKELYTHDRNMYKWRHPVAR